MSADLELPYWIQSADYDSTHADPVGVEAALTVLHTHDWQQELAAQSAKRADGNKVATPGIGFHHGPDTSLHLLHLCPQRDHTWTVHYVYPDTVRRFWFWTAEINRRENAKDVSQETVEEALALFFEDRHYDVLATLERKA